MNIHENILELVGNTPLVRVNKENSSNCCNNIFAKVESFNPAGSIKDRVALNMILEAEKNNLINKNTEIIEPTSGNTGIGLALVCAIKKYKLTIVMPDSMSEERRALMKIYGANLVLTPGKEGMQGAVNKATELHSKNPNSFIPQQFANKANPMAHYNATAIEIYNDLDKNVDIFIAGVGTGGTITGVGKKLKELNKNVKIIAVEPASSPLLTKGVAGSHKIQGIGANFIPDILDTKVLDEIVTIENDEAMEYSRKLAQEEGILVGISAGAAYCAAIKEANKAENKNKNIVFIAPDTGERYISSELFK